MVLGIVMLLVTGGTLLATNTVEHDPLVQGDAVTHYAYRALEAGINSYLNTVNAQPNLVTCSTLTTRLTCTSPTNGVKYDTWTQVPGTTTAGNVPEWYLWTNPQFCFSTKKAQATACTPTSSSGNFEYVQMLVVGAAGTPGHYAYQSSVANFAPRNGFLTHIWWSNFEATDPALQGGAAGTCTYDWNNNYGGPGSRCAEVFFGPNDVVNGPVFTNDSIYVTSKPAFGPSTNPSPVSTADPGCLFVDPNDGHGSPPTCAQASTSDVARYTPTNSHFHVPKELPPTSDSKLKQVAALDGCVYSGPTTISFYATPTTKTGYMNVKSPETRVTSSTGQDKTNSSSNSNVCTGTRIPAPTGAHGNGVLYVQNSTWGNDGSGGCTGNGDNPFDGKLQGRTTTAQMVAPNHYAGTSHGYQFVDDISGHTGSTVAVDCEGDAFVRDAGTANTPSTKVPGIAGNLTVAAANNIVITGNLEYTDCGGGFTGTGTTNCAYNTGANSVNDSLGLIATNYVEVNHPGKPRCTTTYKRYGGWGGGGGSTVTTCTRTPSYVMPNCPANVSDLTAVLCNPGPTLVIDAAILALSHSFAVNEYAVATRQTGSRTPTGKLYVYGAIAQNWRGAIGTFSGSSLVSGYSKYYTWDSRLQYVSIPYYLTPGTPSWALGSSSVVMSSSCPRWPKPYPTGAPYLTTPTKNPRTTSIPGKGPSATTC